MTLNYTGLKFYKSSFKINNRYCIATFNLLFETNKPNIGRFAQSQAINFFGTDKLKIGDSIKRPVWNKYSI